MVITISSVPNIVKLVKSFVSRSKRIEFLKEVGLQDVATFDLIKKATEAYLKTDAEEQHDAGDENQQSSSNGGSDDSNQPSDSGSSRSSSRSEKKSNSESSDSGDQSTGGDGNGDDNPSDEDDGDFIPDYLGGELSLRLLINNT